ncbi:MAG: hypothetical protein M3Q56_11735 [Bacteroidota bacterium]|nr:hypothetical protein [Bacteroidota bacterium]
MSLILLAGQKRTGKTSSLLRWTANKPNVGGILCPDIQKSRFMFDINKKVYIPFESKESELPDLVSIGKYLFLKVAFELGGNVITNSIKQNPISILDEWGPLEINSGGYYPFLIPHLDEISFSSSRHLLMVIRDQLIVDFKKQFPQLEISVFTNWVQSPSTYLDPLLN